MVELSRYSKPLNDFLAGTIREFAAEHPDVEVSCVGFLVDSFNASSFLSFDTKEHSDGQVAKYQHHGSAWSGEDDDGRFMDHPGSFAFTNFRDFAFEGFPEFYDADPVQFFRSPSGTIHHWNIEEDGDEGLNELMWNFFLRDLMRAFRKFEPLKRAPIFRFGICFYDSGIREFWQIEESTRGSP